MAVTAVHIPLTDALRYELVRVGWGLESSARARGASHGELLHVSRGGCNRPRYVPFEDCFASVARC